MPFVDVLRLEAKRQTAPCGARERGAFFLPRAKSKRKDESNGRLSRRSFTQAGPGAMVTASFYSIPLT
jgi:hypothetical protein